MCQLKLATLTSYLRAPWVVAGFGGSCTDWEQFRMNWGVERRGVEGCGVEGCGCTGMELVLQSCPILQCMTCFQ